MKIIRRLMPLFCVIFLSPIVLALAPVSMQDSGNPEWVAQCGKTGGYGACENLADQHFKGNGVPKDLRMTAYYLLKACRYGDMNMCTFAGKMADEEIDDISIYAEAVGRLCEFSDASNCALVWSRFKDPSTEYYSPAFVGRALESGCNKGSGYLCYLMGSWYDDYKPAPHVASDANKASIGFQRTCMSEPTDPNLNRKTIKFGCHSAYKYLLGKDGSPKNLEQAKEAFLRTCEMSDDAESCDYIATAFYFGERGMAKDLSAALSMSERACDLGSEDLCALAGYLYAEKGDEAKAFGLYKKGCERNPNKTDCGSAAARAFTIYGEKNKITIDLALKACEQGDGWSCFLYGSSTFYLSSNGNKEWFNKACDYGLPEGCDEVKRRDEYEANRNNPQYNCPRESCETRTWAEFLRDERATARANNNNKKSTFDIGISAPTRTRTEITPFGSSAREIRNWENYQENQRCSNPTATGC